MKTSAASVGMQNRTRNAAGSIPPMPESRALGSFFTVLRSCNGDLSVKPIDRALRSWRSACCICRRRPLQAWQAPTTPTGTPRHTDDAGSVVM